MFSVAAAAQDFDFAAIMRANGNNRVFAVTADAAGNSYVTGETDAADFPVVAGVQATLSGNYDAFVAKFSASGQLLYSSYLGGTGFDSGRGIAIDVDGNIYVAGFTSSFDFPLRDALDGTLGGNSDAFVTKLDPTGSQILFSTYFGGSLEDNAEAIAVDPDGNVYVAGRTRGGLTLTNPAQSVFGGVEDAFVLKLNASSSAYDYVTYAGGDQIDVAQAISVDASGRACVGGYTSSANFPAVLPWQAGYGGVQDAFYFVLNPPGNVLQLSALLGGDGVDAARSVDCNSTRIAVGGSSTSTNLATFGAVGDDVQSEPGGDEDAFLAEFVISTGLPDYVSYRGGSGADRLDHLDYGFDGDIVWTGTTNSGNFPGTAGAPLALTGTGVFTSTDGGASWQALGLQGVDVNAIAVSPGTPESLLAATDNGLFKSVDGGVSWSPINDPLASRVVHDVEVDPAAPCRWSIAVDSAASDGATPVAGARSTDCGTTWNAWGFPAVRIKSLRRLTQGDRLVINVDRASTSGGGTLKDSCVVDDDGNLRRCLSRGSSSRTIAVDPTDPCRWFEGDEFGSVRKISGNTFGCDHPFSDLGTGAAFGSAVTALEVAAPADPLETEVYAGTENGSVHAYSPAGIWSAQVSSLPCRVDGLHKRNDDKVLASYCRSVSLCTLGGGGCSALATDVPVSGLQQFRQAVSELLAHNAPTADAIVGRLSTGHQYTFRSAGGYCSEEGIDGSVAGSRALFVGNIRDTCGLDPPAQLYGPASPGINALVLAVTVYDLIYRNGFDPP
ncbi:MAG: SBBP repeat-containing protein [Dokdonella sp.]